MFTTLKTTALSLVMIAAASTSFAEGRTPAQAAAQPAASKNDKMDVTDLENKYWAAKDTDFNVVQNRLFSKSNRLALTLNYGMYVSEPWSKGPSYGADLNYYFSERYGMELQYQKVDSSDNAATDAVKAQGGAPNHTKMKGYYGVGFNWIPFYAKMSVLNGSIIYFDMSITPGVGITQYEQQLQAPESNQMQTAPTFSLAVSQHFFLTKWLALRLDYKNYWYKEDVVTYKASSRNMNFSTTSNQSFLMGGLTFYY